MSKTFRHLFLFLAVCAVTALAAELLSARQGLAENAARHQVRMAVDFTVLPMVMPDGSEFPVAPGLSPDASAATSSVKTEESASAEHTEKPKAEPAPAPAPVVGETPAMAPSEGPGLIRAVSLNETSQGFGIVVVADRALGDTAIMNLNDPNRLVVDILGTWRHKGDSVIRSEGVVKHLVMGEHPDRFRMVVHFRTPPEEPVRPDIQKAGEELHVLVALP
ncbi:AMIN domain-containing protein [Pseudodesulfovibrio thermohalotolerans]|uniref:AMIN domain-containing protein n=1 Tax=Pseudodesulfovibrio thermohalotolerans TaxID=2880651 RepID=UPI0022B9DE55|nr:AMIN domain-containing protein [Pseudodesulfovibrio thermohalotolerans]WFS62843.1 AMIN domain-containing protein [Pseudodesulfovibrio thermohalotolerans]